MRLINSYGTFSQLAQLRAQKIRDLFIVLRDDTLARLLSTLTYVFMEALANEHHSASPFEGNCQTEY